MKSILVASGDSSFAERLQRLIKANLPQLSVQHATDGHEVFDSLDPCPDAILMDWDLPDYPGYRVTNAVKTLTTLIPIIQILEHDFVESREMAMRFGADHLLIKDDTFDKGLVDLLLNCC